MTLGSGDRKTIYIWPNWWAQKTSTSPEPCLQFLQTRPHFLKNHVENPKIMKPQKIYWPCGLGPIGTTFQQLALSRRGIQTSPEPLALIFANHTFSRIVRWIQSIRFWNVRKLIDLVGARGLGRLNLGNLGQEDVSSHA